MPIPSPSLFIESLLKFIWIETQENTFLSKIILINIKRQEICLANLSAHITFKHFHIIIEKFLNLEQVNLLLQGKASPSCKEFFKFFAERSKENKFQNESLQVWRDEKEEEKNVSSNLHDIPMAYSVASSRAFFPREASIENAREPEFNFLCCSFFCVFWCFQSEPRLYFFSFVRITRNIKAISAWKSWETKQQRELLRSKWNSFPFLAKFIFFLFRFFIQFLF